MTQLQMCGALHGRQRGPRARRLHALALAAIQGLGGALALAAGAADAATFEVLHHFDGTRGRQPFGGVAIDAQGAILGATVAGGAKDKGVVWRLQERSFAVLHVFRGAPADGDGGYGNVLVDAGGRLVGTTAWGGASNAGTVWTIDATGAYRLLHQSAGGAQGSGVQAGLSAGPDGALYGATLYGGDAACDCGTVFRLDAASGAVTTLHAFGGTEGRYPVAPPLMRADGLHGTTMSGARADAGAPFAMGADGVLSAVTSATGTQFVSGLASDAAQVLWGVWRGGEADNGGLYRIAPDGTFTVVHRFTASEGYWPTGTPLVGRDGRLYGTTSGGGTGGAGTVWRFDHATQRLAVVHAFRGTDGGSPRAGVVEDAQGRLVGVTTGGGRNGAGVVFRIAP